MVDGDISGLKSERSQLHQDKDRLQQQLADVQQTAAGSARSQEQFLQSEKGPNMAEENKQLKARLAQMEGAMQAAQNPGAQAAAAGAQPQAQPAASGYQLPSDRS